MILSAVAIAIALAAGVGLYGWGKQQAVNQTATSDALANQLTALQKAQESQKAELEGIIKQQAVQLEQANRQQETLAKQLDEVQQKVATISGSDAKTWLLAQADFLVKLAGRKLWSDQDVTTAAALLKSADASLADMNDPSLITVRRAITDDIASLSAVSQVDYDGIILKLNQLSNQVDNLRLVPIMTAMVRRWIPTVKSFPVPSANGVSICKKAGRTLWTTSLRFAVVMTPPYRC